MTIEVAETALNAIRAASVRGSFPDAVLEDCGSACLFYAAGFLGRNDAIFVADAGVPEVVLVDADEAKMRAMCDVYGPNGQRPGWEFWGADAETAAARLCAADRRFDLVVCDPWERDMDEVLLHLDEFWPLATRWLVVGVSAAWLDAQAAGAREAEGITVAGRKPVKMWKRSEFRGGNWWLVFDVRHPKDPASPPTCLASLAMIARIDDRDGFEATRHAILSVASACDEIVVVLDERSVSWADTLNRARIGDRLVRAVRRPFTSFSAQRNAAAALCGGEWILVHDADDAFETLGDLRACMEQAPPEIDAIDCREISRRRDGTVAEHGTTVIAYRRDRCHWKYRGHNQLVGKRQILRSTATLNYATVLPSDGEVAKQRADRTIALLLEDYADDPTDPHAPFFLSRAHFLKGDVPGMQRWARECTRLAPTSIPHSPAWVYDAMATLDLSGIDACEPILDAGLAHHRDMPDLWHLKGLVAINRWMRACQKPGNDYLRQHVMTPGYLPRFVEVAGSIGWPIKRKT